MLVRSRVLRSSLQPAIYPTIELFDCLRWYVATRGMFPSFGKNHRQGAAVRAFFGKGMSSMRPYAPYPIHHPNGHGSRRTAENAGKQKTPGFTMEGGGFRTLRNVSER